MSEELAMLQIERAALREQIEHLAGKLRPLYWKAGELKNQVAKTHARWVHVDDTAKVGVTRWEPPTQPLRQIVQTTRRALMEQLDLLNQESIRPLKTQKDDLERELKAVEYIILAATRDATSRSQPGGIAKALSENN